MDKLLKKIKVSLRVSTAVFDDEITDLINACIADLGIAGVVNMGTEDPIIIRAVTTYCRLNFGEPSEPERLKKSYDEQKAQLQMADGYTNWENGNG